MLYVAMLWTTWITAKSILDWDILLARQIAWFNPTFVPKHPAVLVIKNSQIIFKWLMWQKISTYFYLKYDFQYILVHCFLFLTKPYSALKSLFIFILHLLACQTSEGIMVENKQCSEKFSCKGNTCIFRMIILLWQRLLII